MNKTTFLNKLYADGEGSVISGEYQNTSCIGVITRVRPAAGTDLKVMIKLDDNSANAIGEDYLMLIGSFIWHSVDNPDSGSVYNNMKIDWK